MALTCVWLALNPVSTDIAAHRFRVAWWQQARGSVWNFSWFEGHHTPAYSVLAPILGSILGVRTLAVAAVIAAVVAFAVLVSLEPHRAVAVLWFSCLAPVSAFTGRIPFALGFAVGVWGLVGARQPGWRGVLLGGVLGGLTALCSPVAAAFLALACGAWLADAWYRQRANAHPPETAKPLVVIPSGAVAAGFAALFVAAVLMTTFPEGGVFPFPLTAFAPAAAASMIGVAIVRRVNTVSMALVLFLAMCAAAFAIDSAAGANVVRLGTMAIGPAVALYAVGAKKWLVVLAVLSVWWAWWPVHFSANDRGDVSATPAFYRPLLDALDARQASSGVERVEVLPVLTHTEAWVVAQHTPIARGWERQIDRDRNAILFRSTLSPAQFREWLDDNAVALVAVPITAPLDEGAKSEMRVIEQAPSFLSEVWRNADWRLLAVDNPQPLVSGPAHVFHVDAGHLALRADGPGDVIVRWRWSRWLGVTSGPACGIKEFDHRWIQLRMQGAGEVVVASQLVGSTPAC